MKSFKIFTKKRPLEVAEASILHDIQTETSETSPNDFIRKIEKKIDVTNSTSWQDKDSGTSESFQSIKDEFRKPKDLQHVSKPGLVLMASEISSSNKHITSKYINKMKETAGERKEFQELMQVKFNQKEQEKSREISEPLVFVSESYKEVLKKSSIFEQNLKEISSNHSVGDFEENKKKKILQELIISHGNDLEISSSSVVPLPGTEAYLVEESEKETRKIIETIEKLNNGKTREEKLKAARERYLIRKLQKTKSKNS